VNNTAAIRKNTDNQPKAEKVGRLLKVNLQISLAELQGKVYHRFFQLPIYTPSLQRGKRKSRCIPKHQSGLRFNPQFNTPDLL
jgi:hypothetical protein